MFKKRKQHYQEKGIGHITVTSKISKGKVVSVYKTKFGFAGIYKTADLKIVAERLKKHVWKLLKEENPNVDNISVSAKIFHSECEYLIATSGTANP